MTLRNSLHYSETQLSNFLIGGILGGLLFVCLGWIVDLYSSGTPLSLQSILSLYSNNPTHYIIAMAPVVLGLLFLLIGNIKQHDQLMETALEENSIRTQSLLRTMSEGFVAIDDQGIIISTNPATEKLFNYSAGTLTGENVSILIPERFKGQHSEGLKAHANGGENRVVGKGPIRVFGLRSNGQEFPITLSMSSMQIDGSHYYSAAIKDESEAALLRSESHRLSIELDQLLDSIDIPILGTDPWGKILVWNIAFENISGYAREAIIGTNTILKIIVERDQDRVAEMFRASLTGERSAPMEITMRCRNDEEKPMLISLLPRVSDSGAIVGVFGAVQDITTYKQQQDEIKQGQKMQALGQLTGGVAHDFNNFLTIIKGNLKFLLEDDAISDDNREGLVDALSAAEDGSKITKQLLLFAGRQEMQEQVIKLQDAIEASLPLIKRATGEDVEIEISSTAPEAFIEVDPAQLQSALINLATNAEHAMRDRERKLYLKTSTCCLKLAKAVASGKLAPGDYAQIEVRDTGTGMSSEIAARVLDPFFTTKEVGAGTGLGLSTIQGFAQKAGGGLSLRSVEGSGTTVTIWLPIKKT